MNYRYEDQFAELFEESRAKFRKPVPIAPVTNPSRDASNLDRAQALLRSISPASREAWMTVGRVLHYEGQGSREAFDIWDGWSQGAADKYEAKENHRQWKYFNVNHSNPQTISTLLQFGAVAQDRPSVPSPSPDRPWKLFAKADASDEQLAERTMKAVRQRFATYHNQRPSKNEYAGLTQIALCIEAMADSGTGIMRIGGLPSQLPRNYLVSHMAPGTGKSTVVLEAVKLLCGMPLYDEIGVLVLLSRYDEIRKFAAELSERDISYAVIVAKDKDENELGLQGDKTDARVLLTTQEGLRLRSSDRKAFAELDALFFKGKPRQVRIWDEAIMPSRNLKVGADDILAMVKPFKANGEVEFADIIRTLSDTLSVVEDQSVVEVPDWSAFGIAVDDAREWFRGRGDDLVEAAEALIRLSGQTVRVRRDHINNVILHYEDALPPDLAPMLVLDASGAFRQTYSFWHQSRTGLEFLYSPAKRFSGLTIHHWNRGAGNLALLRDQRIIAEAVAKTISSEIPKGEEVLVIHRRTYDRRNTKGAIMAELARVDPERTVHYLSWGYHTATNEYAHVKYVILAGVMNYSVPDFEATGRGAKAMPAQDRLSEADFGSTRAGEVAHNIYQAACRGLVRHSVEGSCPEDCHLYVIADGSEDKGVPAWLLQRTFPGSTICKWQPIIELSSKEQRLVDYMLLREGRMPKSEIAKAIDVAAKNFARTLSDNVRMRLGEHGVTLEEDRQTLTVIRNAKPSWELPF